MTSVTLLTCPLISHHHLSQVPQKCGRRTNLILEAICPLLVVCLSSFSLSPSGARVGVHVHRHAHAHGVLASEDRSACIEPLVSPAYRLHVC